MKTLILYKSKKGMTKKLAELVSQELKSAALYNLNDFNGELNDYEKIIIGSPVYIGKIDKQIKKFIDLNFPSLKTKSTRFFLCGMNYDNTQDVVGLNFSAEQAKTFKIDYIGGAYNFEKLNFLQKFIIKKVSGETESREVVLQERLLQLIK
jgi:menaquinone-dependent protoporphyrinogen oxidase